MYKELYHLKSIYDPKARSKLLILVISNFSIIKIHSFIIRTLYSFNTVILKYIHHLKIVLHFKQLDIVDNPMVYATKI